MKFTPYLRYILLIIFANICLVSCHRPSEHWDTITAMEAIIEERPDSVLNVLQNIDTDKLSGNKERAKHALLYSMALDKNFVDKTDFEVLQPAIDYYEDNGSATDKLRTYYYQGCIYYNIGNNALAMEMFVKAILEGCVSNDVLTKARAYFAQGSIYFSLYEWDNYIEANKSAALHFKQAEKYNSYANCLIRIINGYTLNDDAENALLYINECKKILGVISDKRVADFYSAYLIYVTKYGTNQEIDSLINDYINIITDSFKDWLTLCNAYYKIGKYDDALQATEQYRSSANTQEEIKYKALISMIYEKLGKHEEALRAYKEYMIVYDSKNNAIMRQDTKFVEERYNLELQTLRERESKKIVILWSAFFVTILLAIILFVHYRLKVNRMEKAIAEQETEKYRLLYLQMEEERDALNAMLAEGHIKDGTMEIIKKRLSVLNTIIVSHVSEKETDVKRANDELERLIADRAEFIKSTRLTLEESYPHFFAYLHDKGLEEQEIDFCCLYAIGMKGKEVKAYTNLSRHYKDSSEVRHKLGLSESDTNLSNFLQKMLKNGVE